MNKELQFLLYTTPNENIKIGVVVNNETLWLTQKAMPELIANLRLQLEALNNYQFSNTKNEKKIIIT